MEESLGEIKNSKAEEQQKPTLPPTEKIALKRSEATESESGSFKNDANAMKSDGDAPPYGALLKAAVPPKNKRLAKQFSKEGRMELMLKHRRVHLLLHRQALRGEKRKRSRYQMLLDDQLEENSKMQQRLDTA